MTSFEFDNYFEPQTLIKKEEDAKSPLDTNPKKTCKKKFLKRRKIVTLTGFIAYVALAVYYVVRIILVSVLPYFQEIDFDKNVVALICFAVLALAVAFCLLMVYKRTKHIDLQEE